MNTMSHLYPIFAYFGLYLLFMLVFFIILCLVCIVVLLWYNRRYNLELHSTTEPREDTPMRRPCLSEF